MADKKPIRTVFNSDNVATGLAEFQTGETVGLAHGGLGAALSIGSAGQVIKVNTKNIKVKTEDGNWNVTASLLSAA